jgi:ribosomal protein S18 acetylase RimI-like enzyme
MRVNVTLRPATPADEEFLFEVFAASRDIGLAFLPEPHRSALMRMQYRGQQQTYTQHYPDAEHTIVSLDGADAGRLWIEETDKAITVLDVAILPACRNRGIGSYIYAELIERSKASGKPLNATVSTANPGSLRFHERLGFRRQSSDGLNVALVRFHTDGA